MCLGASVNEGEGAPGEGIKLMGGIFIAYLICGFFAWGVTFAYFRKEFPKKDYRTHIRQAALVALAGPVGLATAYVLSGFAKHGLRWK